MLRSRCAQFHRLNRRGTRGGETPSCISRHLDFGLLVGSLGAVPILVPRGVSGRCRSRGAQNVEFARYCF